MSPLTPLSKRPYKSFTHFCLNHYGVLDHSLKKDFLCPVCGGLGRVIHPDAFCDPVEGYKMAERINCTHCGGPKNAMGPQFEKDWKRKYDDMIMDWRSSVKIIKSKRKLQQSGLKKLTQAEKKALDLL